jgi:hypothetical protein
MLFRVSDIKFNISDNFWFLSWALSPGGTMAELLRSLMLPFAARWLVAMRLSRRHILFVGVVVICASSGPRSGICRKPSWENECGTQLE